MHKQEKQHTDSLEIDGNSVENAIQKALSILKVSREEINVKIVCEEKKGLFGMAGETPAKIKVTLKEKHKKT